MSLSRRKVLRISGAIGIAGIAGCTEITQLISGGCPERKRITVKAEHVTLTSQEQAEITPIVVSNLGEAEQKVIRVAIEEGAYMACIGSEGPGVSKLRDRLAERIGKKGPNYHYVRYNSEFYSLYFRNGDAIYAELHPNSSD